MEEQTAAEKDKKVWSLLVDEMLFGLAGKPRKWEDWKLSSFKKRREPVLNKLKKAIKAIRFLRRKKDWAILKFLLRLV